MLTQLVLDLRLSEKEVKRMMREFGIVIVLAMIVFFPVSIAMATREPEE